LGIKAMTRTLKPGPRPFVALGVVFGVLLCVLIAAALRGSADPSEVFKGAGFVLLLYGIISLNIWRTRIVVSDYSIGLQPAWGSVREVRFQDITVSVAEVLAEPEHPVALNIYGSNKQWPVLSLRLKPYRQQEVSWLLQLPALKVARE
jgi:hypothetical protein